MARFDIDFSAVRDTLSNRNFRIFTSGNAVSLLGTWVQRMAVGYLTWQLTNQVRRMAGRCGHGRVHPCDCTGPHHGCDC